MRDFRKKLQKWTAIPLGDNSYDERGQGESSKSSWAELLPLDSESTQERSKSFSSGWKPVWYTGWHTGVLACATSAVVVLLINVILTIYVATNSKYNMKSGIGTLYEGGCHTSRRIGLWLHLAINVLSTLLLSASNYTQQCLVAPTRSEIDAAHAKRRWMAIGVPSLRNLLKIKIERTLLWVAIGCSSIPLHLVYNSAVYTSLAANDFLVTVVTNNHFERGAYTNTTIVPIYNFKSLSHSTTDPKEYGEIGYQTDSPAIQQFGRMIEGNNTNTESYKDLTLPECTKAYNADFLSNHRNLFLITNHSSNTTHNNTLLDMIRVRSIIPSPSNWMCSYESSSYTSRCNPTQPSSNLKRGLPWKVKLQTAEEVEIAECKSESTPEKCKVQFSLDLMIVVICCNLVKACCMIMVVMRSPEPTLVTLGDAIDSFLRIPDPATMGMCYADRWFIMREWGRGRRTGPKQWKQKGVHRWWTSVSKTRWITCNFFYLINIILVALLLAYLIKIDGEFWSINLKSMWARGLGKVNSVSQIGFFETITWPTLIANYPQTILSFLYLTYNSLFTCMLLGHEWSLFSHHHRTLRVTSPRPGQRSTYWLQIPYTYAIPLMTLSGLLHWLLSQSFFLARVEISDPFGRDTRNPISSVGYSCIAIIILLALSMLSLLIAVGIGYKKFAGEITTVGNCSAAISAACHASGEDSEEIIGKKVRWGDVGFLQNMVERHLTFSSKEEVKKPVFGEVYAGMVGKAE
ncbi:hypothetical protein B9Z19DRAFT_1067337 [Tuber borchii]|uniref:DUF6536 domain-containing protein n=1 Tax=Tuber borchii TaxID=42251 RepID=A0A2T6ZJE5_TUBBO|nr:hypothetical protein B9Z19DRAFT_1067337 [Tuber borchii]